MNLLVATKKRSAPSKMRRWCPGLLTYVIVILALGGLVAGLYPMTAAWVSSYNQSKVIEDALSDIDEISPGPTDQLRLAHAYNQALTSGVRLEAGGNVPVGAGNLSNSELRYESMLKADDDRLMGRVRIPAIDVDLPIYHGTGEDSLLRGAGHLEGTHLPVGGAGTRSVITAHRGLASATMFTNLNHVKEADTFTVEVLGEVLVYQVFDIQVIDPDDSGSLKAVAGEDLVTLITCTPLGINTQRILVTGKRITPTPPKELADAGKPSTVVKFPWWIVIGGAGIITIGTYYTRRGFADARMAANKSLKQDTSRSNI